MLRIATVYVGMIIVILFGCKVSSKTSFYQTDNQELFCQQFHVDLFETLKAEGKSLTEKEFLVKKYNNIEILNAFDSYLGCKSEWIKIGNPTPNQCEYAVYSYWKMPELINSTKIGSADQPTNFNISQEDRLKLIQYSIPTARRMVTHCQQNAGEANCLLAYSVTPTNVSYVVPSHDPQESNIGGRKVHLINTATAKTILAKYSKYYDQNEINKELMKNSFSRESFNRCQYNGDLVQKLENQSQLMQTVERVNLAYWDFDDIKIFIENNPQYADEVTEPAWMDAMLFFTTGSTNLESNIDKHIKNLWKVSSIDTVCKRISKFLEAYDSKISKHIKCKSCVTAIRGQICASTSENVQSFLSAYAHDNTSSNQKNNWYYTRPFIRRILTELIKCGIKHAWEEAWTNNDIVKKITAKLEEQAKKAETKPVKTTLSQDLRKAIISAACNVGFSIAAEAFDSADSYYKDINHGSCDLSPTASQKSACLRSAAGFCDVIFNAGFVDLSGVEKWLRDHASSSEADNAASVVSSFLSTEVAPSLLTSTASAVIQNSAQKLGPLAAAAVSVIGIAGNQISTFFSTGTNDWAHCLGTDKLGACLGLTVADFTTGSHISSYAGSHIAEPTVAKSNSTGAKTYVTGSYCMCERYCVRSSRLYTNKPDKIESVFYSALTKKDDVLISFSDTDTLNACKDHESSVYSKYSANRTYRYRNNSCRLVKVQYPYDANNPHNLPLKGDRVIITSESGNPVVTNVSDTFSGVCGD